MQTARRARCFAILCLWLSVAVVANGQTPATQPTGKTVRLLAVGNSFSGNALRYLPQLAEAGGNHLIAVNAYIGGASMERHMKAVAAFEANPNDKAGKPYKITGDDGKPKMVSLRELLESKPWDFVTVQQASPLSYKPETYEPFGDELVAYIRRYAPQAKIVVHQTWAYRTDNSLFANGQLTQQAMYQKIVAANQAFADHIGAAGIIPCGTAIQNVREDSRWVETIKYAEDLSKLKSPIQFSHSLNADYYWGTKSDGKSGFVTDRFHCSPAGQLVLGAVWYEYFFGDVRNNPFVPDVVPANEAAMFKAIAHQTVVDGLRPKLAATTQPAVAG